jgi:succinoglycan biosynthesis transport protein ExoP
MNYSWIKPQPETQGFTRYINLVRARLGLVVATVAIAIGAAAGYLGRAEKIYEANTDVLVIPVPSDSPLGAIGLLRSSPDPTRDVSTIARLITVPAVAKRVRKQLNLKVSSRSLLSKVRAEPVAQSDIVTITVRANTARDTQRLANAFGDAVIADRTARMHTAIDAAIPGLRRQLAALPSNERGISEPAQRLRELQQLRQSQDPTLRLEVPADLPTAPVSPKPVLSLIVATVGGLVVGLGGVFALQLLDPRLRRRDQLSDRFSLPILAAIPKERQPRKAPPLRRGDLSAGGQEAYNGLRAALKASTPADVPRGRTIMVTGPSRGDGKTTTALNLAAALANLRQDVILLDADWRDPAVARTFNLNSGIDVHADMTSELSLERALVTINQGGPSLRVLPTLPSSLAAEVTFSSPDAASLLMRATAISDWVIIDAPPLNHVPDLLPLAREVDDVLLVVQLGRTDLGELGQLSEMLIQQEITPAGFVVVGAGS